MSVFDAQALADYFAIGSVNSAPQLINAKFQHHVWQLATNQGQYVVKQLNLNAYGVQDLEQFQAAEEIVNHLAQTGDYVVAALQHKDKYLYHDNAGTAYLCFPWVDGQWLDSVQSGKHSVKMAKCLADIHQASLYHPYHADRKSPWSGEAVAMTQYPDELSEWAQLAANAWQNLDAYRVLSHGDLWVRNVLWRDDDSPVIIDWESLSYQHPAVELWRLLVNWAGVTDLRFDDAALRAVYQAYVAVGQVAITIDQTVIRAGYTTWLDWIVYCQQHGDEQAVKHAHDVLTFTEKHAQQFAHVFASSDS